MKKPRGRVVFTGTNRAGTTFLVQRLRNLKLDSGYDPESTQTDLLENARAGLESDVRKEGANIKSRWLSTPSQGPKMRSERT